jgi:hypothetical protein
MLFYAISWVRDFRYLSYGYLTNLTCPVIASGRIQLAQALLGMLPPELTTLGEPEERATEYLRYRQFFMIWEMLERVMEYQAMDVLGMGREARAGWLGDYRVWQICGHCRQLSTMRRIELRSC